MDNPKELKVDDHYIPKMRGMVVYCKRAGQKLKKCDKCTIHLFHNRAAFPLFCLPVNHFPEELIKIEEEAEMYQPSTKKNVLHVRKEKR